MSETILTSDDGLYRVVASTEHDVESPRWGAEFGLMYADHPRYTLGDERVGVLSDLDSILQEQGQGAAIEWLRDKHGATVILPLYLHDHSGLSITAGANLLSQDIPEFVGSSGWDTSLVGCIFDTAENREGLEFIHGNLAYGVEEMLRAEVNEYDMYLQGRVYVLSVEVKVTEVRRSAHTYPDKVVMEDSVHEHWERVDDTVATTYGEDDHATIAADLLAEILHTEAPAAVEG